MANILFGFGGVFIQYGGITCDMPLANGTLRFIPESNYRIAKSGRQVVNFLGWRPEITVQLINISADEARELSKLMTILNSAQGNTIYVYPRYDPFAVTNLLYSCHCISDISPQDIADSPVGQDLTLTFRSELRVTSLPSNITNTDLFTIAETIGGIEYTIAETIDGVSYDIAEEM